MKTIAVIDDDIHIGNVLEELLQREGYAVLRAYSGTEAVLLLERHRPDLVLLDLMLPGMSGFEVCQKVRQAGSLVPIVMLTAREEEDDKVRGLELGADDYITKPFSLNELAARVAAHLRRDERGRNRSSVLASGGLIVNLSERIVSWHGREIPFSKREFDLIEFLMTNGGQVFDKERIYERVWGYDAEGDSGVIKEHIRKIRAKLRDVTGRDYIETVWGVGYKFEVNQ